MKRSLLVARRACIFGSVLPSQRVAPDEKEGLETAVCLYAPGLMLRTETMLLIHGVYVSVSRFSARKQLNAFNVPDPLDV